MSKAAIEQLVKILGQPLPPEYLRVLADYPSVLKNVPRAIDNSDSEGTIEDVELIRDLNSVWKSTKKLEMDPCLIQKELNTSGLISFW